MPKFIDLTGKKFDHFEVIEHFGKDKQAKNLWLLVCQCGVLMISTTHRIFHQEKVSCGCHRSYSSQDYFEKVKRDLLKKRKINGECWEWTGFKYKGYGKRSFYQREKKRKEFVSRIAYILWKGEIPHKHYICHSCDNPACFNPEHLWCGTQAENMLDMKRKKRGRGRYSK